jgi:hypothetical protein
MQQSQGKERDETQSCERRECALFDARKGRCHAPRPGSAGPFLGHRINPPSFAIWGELLRRRSSSKRGVAINELFACGLNFAPGTGRGSTGRSRTGLRVFPVGSTLIVLIARFSAAERHSRCTVTIDETRSAKHRANRAGRPLRPVQSPAVRGVALSQLRVHATRCTQHRYEM